jgi:hypothetical protein
VCEKRSRLPNGRWSTIDSVTGQSLPSMVTVSMSNAGLPRDCEAWAKTSSAEAMVGPNPK